MLLLVATAVYATLHKYGPSAFESSSQPTLHCGWSTGLHAILLDCSVMCCTHINSLSLVSLCALCAIDFLTEIWTCKFKKNVKNIILLAFRW